MAKKKVTTTKKQTNAEILSAAQDVKSAILVVSLTINVIIFIAWIVLRVTTKYDEQVFNFLFTR